MKVDKINPLKHEKIVSTMNYTKLIFSNSFFNFMFIITYSRINKESKKRIMISSNQHLFKIKKNIQKNLSVANDLVKKISNKFGINCSRK